MKSRLRRRESRSPRWADRYAGMAGSQSGGMLHKEASGGEVRGRRETDAGVQKSGLSSQPQS